MYRASEESAAQRRSERPARELGPLWLTALVTVMLLAVGLRIGFAVDPQRPQEPDSIGYARIAKSLYLHGKFEEGGFRTHTQQPSNYSPGLPLFVAGLYFATGGVHLELARTVLALIGSLGVLFAFAIGNRLAGPAAGIVAALVVTVYPALLQYQGMLMTEPLAVTLLAAALLAFLWAGEQDRPPWAWGLPGLLLGLLAVMRPEYLLFGLLAVPLALLRAGRRSQGWGQGALAALLLGLALLLPIVPWTVRNAIVLDRLVPISTGGGKALYVGTYLPSDGDGPRLREQLLTQHPAVAKRVDRLAPSNRLDTLLALLAARKHPGLDTDAALQRMGRDNIDRYASKHPNDFGAMLARKAYRAWREGPRSIMHSSFWKGFQKALALFGLLGLGVLAFRRRWEALPLALLVLTTTATSALLIASPRRVLVILPAVAALAGAGLVWLAERARALRP